MKWKHRFLGIIILISLSMIFSGCALFKKKTVAQPEPEKKVEQPVKKVVETKVEEPKLTPEEIFKQNYAKLPTSHTVVKGECLWWIAEYKQIYNDPFMWPLIYKANRDKIKNPDLIYPNQVFEIPREFTLDELKESRRSAGAPRPYLPPEDANVPLDIRVKLGWNY